MGYFKGYSKQWHFGCVLTQDSGWKLAVTTFTLSPLVHVNIPYSFVHVCVCAVCACTCGTVYV